MLSSHRFLCLPCLLPPFTVARSFWPDLMNGKHDHTTAACVSLIVRRSSCGPIACWMLAWTCSLVTWSLHEMCSIPRQHPTSMACTPPWSSAVRAHYPQAHRKTDATRERASRIPEPRETPPPIQTGLSLANAAAVRAITDSISGPEPPPATTEPRHSNPATVSSPRQFTLISVLFVTSLIILARTSTP